MSPLHESMMMMMLYV